VKDSEGTIEQRIAELFELRDWPNARLRIFLDDAGIRVGQAAKDLKISGAAFYAYCSGKAIPRPTQRRRIAQYLNLPEETLWPYLGK
jgi:hypothetical protein